MHAWTNRTNASTRNRQMPALRTAHTPVCTTKTTAAALGFPPSGEERITRPDSGRLSAAITWDFATSDAFTVRLWTRDRAGQWRKAGVADSAHTHEHALALAERMLAMGHTTLCTFFAPSREGDQHAPCPRWPGI